MGLRQPEVVWLVHYLTDTELPVEQPDMEVSAVGQSHCSTVLPLLFSQAGPTTWETALGPSLGWVGTDRSQSASFGAARVY